MKWLRVVSLIVIALAVAGALFVKTRVRREAAKQTPPTRLAESAQPRKPASRPASSQNLPLTRESARTRPASVRSQSNSSTSPAASLAAPDVEPADGEPLISEPLARLALSLVGTDPDAEFVWALAINDPNLAPDERKNLIEDLNEDGFPDPKNLTAEDLPLIVSRLQLIEDLAPDAMDDANADAFAEAYKDLTNMYARLTSR